MGKWGTLTEAEVTAHEIEKIKKQAYAAGYRDGWESRQEAEKEERKKVDITQAGKGQGSESRER
jgi:hypothetical protein